MSFALLEFGDHVGRLASPVGVSNYIYGDESLYMKVLLGCTGCMSLAAIIALALKKHLATQNGRLEDVLVREDECQTCVTERSMYIRPHMDVHGVKRFRRVRLYNKSAVLDSRCNAVLKRVRLHIVESV